MRVDLRRAASHYAVASLFDNFSAEEAIYCYRVRQDDFETFRAGRAKMAMGSVTITSLITREEAQFEFTVIHLGETELTGGVRPTTDAAHYEAMKRDLSEDMRVNGVSSVIRVLDEYFEEPLLSIRALFARAAPHPQSAVRYNLNEARARFANCTSATTRSCASTRRSAFLCRCPLRTAAEFDVNMQLRRLLDREELPRSEIEVLLRESRRGVALDETTLMALKHALERAAIESRRGAG
jgi:hypothetical protein